MYWTLLIIALIQPQGPQPPAPGATPPVAAPPAQSPPAQSPPAQFPPADTAEQAISDLEAAAPKREPIRPTLPPAADPVIPGNTSAAVDPATGRAVRGARPVREGTFLVSRRGRMVRAATGEWMLVFDNDATGKADPPMRLQPCETLMAMERSLSAATAGATSGAAQAPTYLVSGQVFVYYGRNYLLPTTFSPVRAESAGGVGR